MQDSLQTARLSKRRFRRLGIVLSIFVLFVGTSQATLGWRRAGSLANAVEGADRIFISRAVISPRKELENVVEIRGVHNVAAFLGLIDIDELRTIPGGECRCWGGVQIEFRRGDQKLARIAFAHDQSLKWYGGSWFGDSTLTRSSQDAIRLWLEKNAPSKKRP